MKCNLVICSSQTVVLEGGSSLASGNIDAMLTIPVPPSRFCEGRELSTNTLPGL